MLKGIGDGALLWNQSWMNLQINLHGHKSFILKPQYYTIIYFALGIGLLSCKSSPIVIDYCEMIKSDQSFVNTDKSDMDQFNADRQARHKIFNSNFDAIMQLTSQEGFPYVSLSTYPADSCKYWAVTMTMIHTAQADPEVFFSKKVAKIFETEMKKGNLEKGLLEKSCIISSRTSEFCEHLRTDIQYATKLWGLKPDIFDESKFVECSE